METRFLVVADSPPLTQIDLALVGEILPRREVKTL